MNGNLFDDARSAGPVAGSGWFTAHCDGGSRGNPGPSGYGAVVEDPEGRVVARLSEYLGKQTNNYAEYSGLLAVLEWALANGARQLRVVSDSELMVNQMKGRYKVGSPGLRPLWEEAKRRASRLDRFDIGHTLRGGNKEADQLANEAMDRGMGKGGGVSGAGGGSGVSKAASQQISGSASPQSSKPAGQRVGESAVPRQVLEGYVKNGVIHLLDGELPDGTFVKITRV